MMELKFRAWTPWYNGHMHQVAKFDTARNPPYWFVPLVGWNETYSPTVPVEGGTINREDCDFELMQYTGLKDKNGKEIYEGDILKIKLPMTGFWKGYTQPKVGQVQYESDRGGYIVEWEYSKNQHHINLDCDIACGAEIIGNIYENPELIKDATAVLTPRTRCTEVTINGVNVKPSR